MSKVLTTRYEYVCYDDAEVGSNLTASPPLYPSPLDQYSTTTVGTAGVGYGVINVNGTTSVQSMVPSGASCTVVASGSNTTMLNVTGTGSPIPGAAASSLTLTCGPGQTISYCGTWHSGTLTLASSAAFTAQILWSW
jgi:hypothetical protein